MEPLLTPEQIAAWLQLEAGVAAVYELVRARAKNPLPAIRIGKYLRFRRSAVDAWIARRAK